MQAINENFIFDVFAILVLSRSLQNSPHCVRIVMEIPMRISWKIRTCVKISRSWKISMLETDLYYVLLLTYLVFDDRLHSFYKQLGWSANPQSCLYFQCFQGSKLVSSCLVNWINTVNRKYILIMFRVSPCQHIFKLLRFRKFKEILR